MTRIEQARRRVATTRYALGIGAAVALAAAVSELDQDGGFFGDDSSSTIGPSGSAAPQLRSGAS